MKAGFRVQGSGCREKLKKLHKILIKKGRIVVAFSGGVDSTFLLKTAKDVLGKKNVLAVTIDSEFVSRSELNNAKRLAKLIGVKHIVIKVGILGVEGVMANTPQRCYYCKSKILSRIKIASRAEDFKCVADGTNYEDRKDFRPGRRALKESNVSSPLKEAHFTKDDICQLSRKAHLPTWNRPSNSCLASRIPYYDVITQDKLKTIEAAEDLLCGKFGFERIRLRHHGDIARIETAPDEIHRFLDKGMRQRFVAKIKALGFKYVTVDLQGRFYRFPT